MEATVLTLLFDSGRGGFPAEELADFCLGAKKSHTSPTIASGHFI
ncbi:MAG: hypothetical protein AAF399_21835 [Bacteroidota bacterium]